MSNKISLEKLFDCKTNSNQKMSVMSLAGKEEEQFDIKKLLEVKNKGRKDLLDEFIRQHKSCLRKIELANSIGKYDIVFVVAKYVTNLPQYNARDCLIFISNKLNSVYIDTLFINETTMFITWKFIELNIQNADDDMASNNSDN